MNSKTNGIKHDALKYATVILFLFCCGWGLVFLFFSKYPALLAMAFLSFTFGLQHAFDLDHITTIDNVTRKLINEHQNSHGVGFFFSLGHSFVVILMALVTILFMSWSKKELPHLKIVGNIFGPVISGSVLTLLGLINIFLLVSEYKQLHNFSKNDANEISQKDEPKIVKFFTKKINFIHSSAQMIIVGFFFGLGFDTATQISVLATSAVATSEGIPWFAIISFPLLFTAGMCLMDTTDGLFMSAAYGWLFSSPIQKLIYNIVLTGLSATVAILVGVVEFIQVMGMEFNYSNWLISWCMNLNFLKLGILLALALALIWGSSLIIYHRTRVNQVD